VVVNQVLLADQVGVGLVSRQAREVREQQDKEMLVAVVTEVLPLVSQEAVVVAQVELVVTEQVRRVVLVAQVVHQPLQGQALLAQAAVVADQEMERDLAALLDQAAEVLAAAHLLKMVVLVQQTLAAVVGRVVLLPQILQTVAMAVRV
jgi:hypothetical protein